MGFSKAGEHISKSYRVESGRHQHRQSHREGRLPHSYNIVHVRQCVRLRLKVEMLRNSGPRAESAGAAFRQAVGPVNSIYGRARRGRKPSLLHRSDERARARLGRRFLRSSWYQPSCRAPASQPFDHISQSMHYTNAYLAALLQIPFSNVTSCRNRHPDPGGLVKSQVLQSGDGAIRRFLNAHNLLKQCPRWFLSEAFGSECNISRLQHRATFRDCQSLA